MSKEEDFLARWGGEKAMYLAWGQHVSEAIRAALAPAIEPVSTSYFLKTIVEPRLKTDEKLVEKAFYRNKPYPDPFVGITDKVGTRFVVLLGSDVRTVVQAIEGIPGWTRSRDRDYEEEQKKNPVAFEYAAVHFVVAPLEPVMVGEVVVAAGTPCEVQVKTLLQHAYSELTHDTIYKPQIDATPRMQRDAAKAMALLEATNDYFEKVSDEVNAALAAVREITRQLTAIYHQATGIDAKPSVLEGLLLGAFEDQIPGDYADQIRALLIEKPFIAERIKSRVATRSPLFAQPSILLAYLAIYQSVIRAKRIWPLTPMELEPLLNDLGASVN